MSKKLENVTLETLSEAVRRAGIQPGQHFSIVVEETTGGQDSGRPSLSRLAARMRNTAASRGLTTEIFDSLLSQS